MTNLPQLLNPLGATCLAQVVLGYATWLVGRMSHEQQLKLTRNFTWMNLCAGLGTPFIAYEGCAPRLAAIWYVHRRLMHWPYRDVQGQA